MRILLVDDHAIVRDGLRAILEREPDIRIAAEASNGRDAIEIAGRIRPDVVVMDIGMSGLNGIDATLRIVEDNPKAKVLCLSMNSDRHYVEAMFAAGASGYLVKDSASTELISALRMVVANQVYASAVVSEFVVAKMRGIASPRAEGRLTTREREVLQLLAEGKASKEIATALRVAVPTVETHRRQLMSKLGIHTVAELTKYAIRQGITLLQE